MNSLNFNAVFFDIYASFRLLRRLRSHHQHPARELSRPVNPSLRQYFVRGDHAKKQQQEIFTYTILNTYRFGQVSTYLVTPTTILSRTFLPVTFRIFQDAFYYMHVLDCTPVWVSFSPCTLSVIEFFCSSRDVILSLTELSQLSFLLQL